ncbi:MAG: hypothetical protein AM326_01635 [Candidatus Thorarchaeota archaeon SMTZ-45]|nr:MAG: hypothetical protein AM326_01635 [Candidatus Thorarchaeota archaeon SMTZ-45]
MQEIGSIFHFEAAHRLPRHTGKCKDLHGHSYKLEVTVEGEPCRQEARSDWGMIMDFTDFKNIVREVVLDLHDHQDLNNIYPNPTAENMVIAIASAISEKLPGGVALTMVRLWETEKNYAIWRTS